jgi:hypothetical protein
MNTNERVVVLDIDGLACEHAKAICEWIVEQYGVSSTVDDVTTWDHDFGPVTFVQAVETCYQGEGFIMKMEVTPGFHAFLNKLSRIAKVVFASGRKHGQDFTRLWVKKNFGEFETFFVKRKANLQCSYIVDDYLPEVETGVKAGKMCFLFKRPWNDNDQTKTVICQLGNAYFVESFNEILALLEHVDG